MSMMMKIKSFIVLLVVVGFIPVFAMEKKQETAKRVMPVRAVVTEVIKRKRAADTRAAETVTKKRKKNIAPQEVKQNVIEISVEKPQREILMYPPKVKIAVSEQWMKDNDITRSGNIFFVPDNFDETRIDKKKKPCCRCYDSAVFKAT